MKDKFTVKGVESMIFFQFKTILNKQACKSIWWPDTVAKTWSQTQFDPMNVAGEEG